MPFSTLLISDAEAWPGRGFITERRHPEGFGLFQLPLVHDTPSAACNAMGTASAFGQGGGILAWIREPGAGGWTSIREGRTTSHTHISAPSIMSFNVSTSWFRWFSGMSFPGGHFFFLPFFQG